MFYDSLIFKSIMIFRETNAGDIKEILIVRKGNHLEEEIKFEMT